MTKTLAERHSFHDNLNTLTIFVFSKVNQYSQTSAAAVDQRNLKVKVAQ